VDVREDDHGGEALPSFIIALRYLIAVQIMTRKPLHTVPWMSRLVATTQIRPPQPTEREVVKRGMSDKLYGLVLDCWKQDPARRATIEEIVARLEDCHHQWLSRKNEMPSA
jgi:hypothetical protein